MNTPPQCQHRYEVSSPIDTVESCIRCGDIRLTEPIISAPAMIEPILPYTEEDSDRAYRDWQATCGPHSIAAACQVSLDDVRGAIPNYRGWMSPTQIGRTLYNLKKGFSLSQTELPTKTSLDLGPGNYIARIQWEGSWLNPGVPVAAAYHHTHYIAVLGGIAVLDTMRECAELIPAEWWLEMEDDLVAAEVKRSTGWHFTHVWRIKS